MKEFRPHKEGIATSYSYFHLFHLAGKNSDLIKKGLRPEKPRVIVRQRRKNSDLIKKGLRPLGITPASTDRIMKEFRPHKEGIATHGTDDYIVSGSVKEFRPHKEGIATVRKSCDKKRAGGKEFRPHKEGIATYARCTFRFHWLKEFRPHKEGIATLRLSYYPSTRVRKNSDLIKKGLRQA